MVPSCEGTQFGAGDSGYRWWCKLQPDNPVSIQTSAPATPGGSSTQAHTMCSGDSVEMRWRGTYHSSTPNEMLAHSGLSLPQSAHFLFSGSSTLSCSISFPSWERDASTHHHNQKRYCNVSKFRKFLLWNGWVRPTQDWRPTRGFSQGSQGTSQHLPLSAIGCTRTSPSPPPGRPHAPTKAKRRDEHGAAPRFRVEGA